MQIQEFLSYLVHKQTHKPTNKPKCKHNFLDTGNEFWPPNVTNRNNLDGKLCAETKKKNLKRKISKTKCLNFWLGLTDCLSVCQSLHTLQTTYLCGCWVSSQFWFGVGGTWIGVWIFFWLGLGGGFLWNS